MKVQAKDLKHGDHVDLEGCEYYTGVGDKRMAEYEMAVVDAVRYLPGGAMVHFEQHTSLYVTNTYEFEVTTTRREILAERMYREALPGLQPFAELPQAGRDMWLRAADVALDEIGE